MDCLYKQKGVMKPGFTFSRFYFFYRAENQICLISWSNMFSSFIYLFVFARTKKSFRAFHVYFLGRKYASISPAKQKLINVPIGFLPYILCRI